jgi:competence ComEA-like helix-hairpin-helix protein
MVREWIKDYFYHTATERKGMAVLGFCTVFFMVLPYAFPYFIKDQNKLDIVALNIEVAKIKRNQPQANAEDGADIEKDFANYKPFPFNPNTATQKDFAQLGLSEKVINTLMHYREKGGKFYKPEDFKKIWGLKEADFLRLKDYINLESVSYAKKYDYKEKKEIEEVVIEYNNFDPNLASIDDLLKLGIPKKTAYMITHYREKGGKFRKKEDLKKIYGMPEDIYYKLENYIVIPDNKVVASNIVDKGVNNNPSANPSIPNTAIPNAYNNTTPKKFPAAAPVNIDINKSTMEDWTKLNGIGPGYAKRIVTFRDKLGGFCNVDQVKETFGLPDSTFQKIKTQLSVSPILKKINVNVATVEELKLHPYLKWNQVNIIVNYRAQHGGKIANFEELKKIQGLPADVLEKVKPYLEF